MKVNTCRQGLIQMNETQRHDVLELPASTGFLRTSKKSPLLLIVIDLMGTSAAAVPAARTSLKDESSS